MMICRARFGRGFGFGNRLFPWARCGVFSARHGVPMVAPVWFRPAVGQLFRGGVSYGSYLRQIMLAGLFRPGPDDIGLGRYAYLRLTRGLTVVGEPPDLLATDWPSSWPNDDCLVTFEGVGAFFEPLNGHAPLLLERLRSIAHPRYLALADAPPDVPIGICVRLGNDFAEPVAVDGRITGLRKTPVDWFVTMLRAVRVAAGRRARAYVVSDGTPAQLSALLAEPDVTFVRPGTAIGDLLLLSRARVLLASGASTFAAWGAFLGQMPSATHPGQPLRWWKIAPARGQYCDEVDCHDIDGEFLRQAVQAMAAESRRL